MWIILGKFGMFLLWGFLALLALCAFMLLLYAFVYMLALILGLVYTLIGKESPIWVDVVLDT